MSEADLAHAVVAKWLADNPPLDQDYRDVIARAVCRAVWDIDIDNYDEAGTVMPRKARHAADLALDNLRAARLQIVPILEEDGAGMAREG